MMMAARGREGRKRKEEKQESEGNPKLSKWSDLQAHACAPGAGRQSQARYRAGQQGGRPARSAGGSGGTHRLAGSAGGPPRASCPRRSCCCSSCPSCPGWPARCPTSCRSPSWNRRKTSPRTSSRASGRNPLQQGREMSRFI